VLPSLGEDGALVCAVNDLVDGGEAEEEADPEVRRLLGDGRVVDAVGAAVRLWQRPPRRRTPIETAWGTVVLGPAEWSEVFADADGLPHNALRARAWERLLDVLEDRVDDELRDGGGGGDGWGEGWERRPVPRPAPVTTSTPTGGLGRGRVDARDARERRGAAGALRPGLAAAGSRCAAARSAHDGRDAAALRAVAERCRGRRADHARRSDAMDRRRPALLDARAARGRPAARCVRAETDARPPRSIG
jgi:hypothetical protein